VRLSGVEMPQKIGRIRGKTLDTLAPGRGAGPPGTDERRNLGVPTGGGPVQATRYSTHDYELLTGTIRETVDRVVPVGATVVVVSRGDEELLRLGPRRTLHFPQDEDGKYAGYHPADSDAVIAMVEELRNRGADFFLLPATAFWWLDYYERFREYVERQYEVVAAGDDCWIARLGQAPAEVVEKHPMEQSSGPLAQPIAEIMSRLLPDDARIAVLSLGSDDLARTIGYESWALTDQVADDEATAVASLGMLESDRVRFAVVPATLYEWLEDHPAVGSRLRENYRLVTRQQHFCEIYERRMAYRAVEAPSPPDRVQEGDGRPLSLRERLKAIFRTQPG
jgi:hypothetical protein